jgi:hypothetical protein
MKNKILNLSKKLVYPIVNAHINIFIQKYNGENGLLKQIEFFFCMILFYTYTWGDKL